MPPSLETRGKIETFLEAFQDEYEIRYLDMTDSTNAVLMKGLGLPTEHFPFGLAVNGRTSAEIDGETIVFTHFPDFMHHIGKHRGNWTLEHLEKALKDPGMLLPENPVVKSVPGGSGKQEHEEE